MSLVFLIQALLVLAVVGLILYLIETYIPMDPVIKTVIRVIIVIVIILWLLQLVGMNVFTSSPRLVR